MPYFERCLIDFISPRLSCRILFRSIDLLPLLFFIDLSFILILIYYFHYFHISCLFVYYLLIIIWYIWLISLFSPLFHCRHFDDIFLHLLIPSFTLAYLPDHHSLSSPLIDKVAISIWLLLILLRAAIMLDILLRHYLRCSLHLFHIFFRCPFRWLLPLSDLPELSPLSLIFIDARLFSLLFDI